jgi:beta-N-acetylhexosaminidase
VLRALQAGADVALWVTTGEVPAVLDHLEKSVNAGQLAVPRLDDSLRRLAAAKCG